LSYTGTHAESYLPDERYVRPLVYSLDNMEHSKTIGDRTTPAVMAALETAGYDLRVDPARNAQRRRTRHAADYEIASVAVRRNPS
jgi:hypothetical protein